MLQLGDLLSTAWIPEGALPDASSRTREWGPECRELVDWLEGKHTHAGSTDTVYFPTLGQPPKHSILGLCWSLQLNGLFPGWLSRKHRRRNDPGENALPHFLGSLLATSGSAAAMEWADVRFSPEGVEVYAEGEIDEGP